MISTRLERIAERWARSYRSLLTYDEGVLHAPDGYPGEGILWRIIYVGGYDRNHWGGSVPLLDNYIFLGEKSRRFDAAIKSLSPKLQDPVICRYYHPGRLPEWAQFQNISVREHLRRYEIAMDKLEKLVNVAF